MDFNRSIVDRMVSGGFLPLSVSSVYNARVDAAVVTAVAAGWWAPYAVVVLADGCRDPRPREALVVYDKSCDEAKLGFTARLIGKSPEGIVEAIDDLRGIVAWREPGHEIDMVMLVRVEDASGCDEARARAGASRLAGLLGARAAYTARFQDISTYGRGVYEDSLTDSVIEIKAGGRRGLRHARSLFTPSDSADLLPARIIVSRRRGKQRTGALRVLDEADRVRHAEPESLVVATMDFSSFTLTLAASGRFRLAWYTVPWPDVTRGEAERLLVYAALAALVVNKKNRDQHTVVYKDIDHDTLLAVAESGLPRLRWEAALWLVREASV